MLLTNHSADSIWDQGNSCMCLWNGTALSRQRLSWQMYLEVLQ